MVPSNIGTCIDKINVYVLRRLAGWRFTFFLYFTFYVKIVNIIDNIFNYYAQAYIFYLRK